MTSSVKETFPNNNSWISRSGVIVGYKPEDTMKSFLFNQNNRHCINLCQTDMLPQNEIEKALNFLSSDSESESSSMTKITVKNAPSSVKDISSKLEEKTSLNKNTKSGADLEIWNKSGNSDSDCTSNDISYDFADDGGDREHKVTNIPKNKSFEEILEEKLKHEENFSKSQKGPCKSGPPRIKSKFPFLKKNEGKAAWCSNVHSQSGQPLKSKSNTKGRSQSNDRIVSIKPPISLQKPLQQHHQESNNNHHPPINKKKQQQPINEKKPVSSMVRKSNELSINKEKPPPNNSRKTVHFAASFNSNCDLDLKEEEPIKMMDANEHIAEVEDQTLTSFENHNLDKDLVEFELLEQIANVSISSSVVSSIAFYEEDSLREKLKKCRHMLPPTSYNQNMYSINHKPCEENKISKVPEIKLPQELSICEENVENLKCPVISSDTEMVYPTDDYCNGGDDNDDRSVSVSVNTTTTLSEFLEPESYKTNNKPTPFLKTNNQAFTRKISKQNDRCKSSDPETEEWVDDIAPLQSTKSNSQDSSIPVISAKPSSVHWTFADPFHQSISSIDDEDDNDNINNNTDEEEDDGDRNSLFVTTTEQKVNPASSVKSIYPAVVMDKTQSNPEENIAIQSAKLKQWVQLLESEVKRFKCENEEIEKLKAEKKDGLKRLEEEMNSFKKYREEELKKFEEYKQNEIKKLKKERKVFEDFQEAMKNMPNKKDRQEIENLKTEIEQLKEETMNKDTRWQAATSRMKQKVEQLELENSEMHSRIHALEQKRLQLQSQLISNSNHKQKSDTTITNRPKQTVTSVSQAVSMKHSNIPIGSSSSSSTATSITKEDNNNINSKSVANSAKISYQTKKTNIKINNNNTANNSSKVQKVIKMSENPFSDENGMGNIRGSVASDYYTGEEESGSVELNSNKINTPLNEPDYQIVNDNQRSSDMIKIDRSNDIVQEEIHHPDGIVERIYVNGGIDVAYPNGSLKQISADSKYIVVHLYNGDIKQITPDGRVIYFYAQDESTQTTYLNGKEEIIYKNGHKEIIHPNGIREIYFPDKSIKVLHPDSSEETFLPNGLVIRITPNGDKEILLPNGQKEIHSNGIKKRIYPDGTTKTVYPDGRQETFYSSGRMRAKDKNGNLILDQYISKPVP